MKANHTDIIRLFEQKASKGFTINLLKMIETMNK